MKKENRSHILLRFLVVIGLTMILVGRVVYFAFDNTVVTAPRWNAKAMKELSRTDTICPERGDILSHSGQILATNLSFYTVRMDFRSEKFMEEDYLLALNALADSMGKHFPQRTRDEWHRHLKKPMDMEKSKRPRAYRILGNISYTDYQLLRTFPFFSIKNPNRNGLTKERTNRRVNPYGAMARRSVGGVGIHPVSGQIHGISGLECALDSLLYGKPGMAKKVPLTKDIVNWTDVAPIPGYDIRTTIDINMQDIVENELNQVLSEVDAEWGVAVLMEVPTGNIRAISNLEKNPHGHEYIEGMNRAVLGYEPGSVIKTLSMMIALEDGIVTNVDRVIETGNAFPYAGGKAITDSHPTASMTVKEVIERSSNIGMAKIITSRYGDNPGAFYSRIKGLGFLDPMHTGIAGERRPRIDSVANNRGGRIALSRMCYGYTTEVPPLYTLSLYNAIANDGTYVKPRLVDCLHGADGVDSVIPVSYMGTGKVCSPRTASTMRMMLTNVVWGEHGTARLLRNERVRIAGKTGTCYSIDGSGYNTSKKRLAFCGFFPADKPLYSCIVLTYWPKRNAFGAASTSGAVVRNIALKMYSRGMLNNQSELVRDPAATPTVPTLFASGRMGNVTHLDRRFKLGSARHIKSRANVGGGMPSVVGYSLREAINMLESKGVNVSVNGSGYVVGQSVAPGTHITPGQRITLTLGQ